MCEYCDLKKSEEYGGIYRGETMADREFFEACHDVPTKSVRIFLAENNMCTSGLGLYLDEGNMANVIGLKHIDSVSVNFCFHCGKSAKEILKKIEKEGNPRFGCDSELKVDDEMDDVSDWAKDAAKKLTEVK